MISKAKQSIWSLAEMILPWMVLLFLANYTVGLFAFLPDAGVQISTNVINKVFYEGEGGIGFQPVDVILQAGSVTAQQVADDLRTGFFEGLKTNETVAVTVMRQGQTISFNYTMPGPLAGEIRGRLESQWFIPYIFWLAGTAALLFLRPRSGLRLLLALFGYVTAIWLSASTLSARHFWDGALLLCSATWLSVPVYLHLHWLFPSPLRKLPNWTWAMLYAVCTVLAVLSWFQFVPQRLYFIGFILMVAGSLVLLAVHLVVQPAERRTLAGLAAALGLVLLPALGFGVLGLLRVNNVFTGMSVLGLAALPGFYFFTLFRRQLNPIQVPRADRLVRVYVGVILIGLLFCSILILVIQSPFIYQSYPVFSTIAFAILMVIALVNFVPFLVLPALGNENITLSVGGAHLSFGANRGAAGVLFILLDALVALLLALVIHLLNPPAADNVSLVAAALGTAALALLGYPAFQRFFDRSVLGMPLTLEGLARAFAARITTSLERPALGRLLVEEVMPSLLVRQFAQWVQNNGTLTASFGLRAEADMLPRAESYTALGTAVGRELPDHDSRFPGWIRLVIPLRAGSELRGYWLLGRRDPDDRYSAEDIAVFQSLADQTALALVNIDQAEALQALYFADIERNESERLQMAAELHDDVLNQLAVLNMNLQTAAPAALQAYDQAVFHIRQIINGLRPAMLNHGLHTALETLVDELNDRLAHQGGGPRVLLEIAAEVVRYDPRVELSLFRIVQQSCSNAIQHAMCHDNPHHGRTAAGTCR